MTAEPTSFAPDEAAPEPVVRPARPDRVWLHGFLFVATFLTTTLVGADHYASFLSDLGRSPVNLPIPALLVRGLWYSLTILAILGAHEMGHYVACRYYGVRATLPFFLPFLGLTGTLGAVIRMREPIRFKQPLFDIGVAGPIAGFLVALPALVIGLALSTTVVIPPDFVGFNLGEPLLFKAASYLLWGTQPDGHSINLHPMAFAAWFGLLATALNLFPIGQLDGGHITYALLGRRSTWITLAALAATLALSYFSRSWLVWSVVLVAMVAMFGPRHPPTLDEAVPLDPVRKLVAAFALLMLVLCFTPAPIEPLDLLGAR